MRPYTAIAVLNFILNFCGHFHINSSAATAAVNKFTNLQCETMDPEFLNFGECRLRVITRGQVGLNVHIRLFKVPVTNIALNLALYKKANGYKPFMYNITHDFCTFANKSSNNIFMKIVMNFFAEYSNFNHSCPYDHDLIVKNLILQDKKFRLIPLPSGEYLLKIVGYSSNDAKLALNVYFARDE